MVVLTLKLLPLGATEHDWTEETNLSALLQGWRKYTKTEQSHHMPIRKLTSTLKTFYATLLSLAILHALSDA